MEPHRAERFGEGVVISGNHATFRSRQVFVGVKTKGGQVADTTDMLPFVFGRDGVGGIIDEDEVVISADLL